MVEREDSRRGEEGRLRAGAKGRSQRGGPQGPSPEQAANLEEREERSWSRWSSRVSLTCTALGALLDLRPPGRSRHGGTIAPSHVRSDLRLFS